MPVTPGMKGEGYYDQYSSGQRASIQLLHGWLEEAVAELVLPPETLPVTLLDLGSSEGKNAIEMMRQLASALRHFTRQPIQTVYNDLPSSNFNRLFTSLHDPAQTGGFPPDVFASAVAGSFYGPLVPGGTVHLATCFNALLWLDHLPDVLIPDFVVYRRPVPPRPGLQVPPRVEEAFRTQADADLVRFLHCRAKELVPGGKLLIASPGDDARGRVVDGLYDALNDALLDLVARGVVPRDRCERLLIPIYTRTVEETIAPLDRANSPVRGLFSVDRAETLEVPTPFLIEFQRSGDVQTFAADYTGFLRAFTEPIVRKALAGPGLAPQVIDQVYQRIQERLQQEPQRYQFRYVLTAVRLTRTGAAA